MDFKITAENRNWLSKQRAAMHTFLFLNQRRRVRRSWPWVLAACGCTVFAQASAPSASTTAHEGQIALEPAARTQNAIPSEANSRSHIPKPPPLILLEVAGGLVCHPRGACRARQ